MPIEVLDLSLKKNLVMYLKGIVTKREEKMGVQVGVGRERKCFHP